MNMLSINKVSKFYGSHTALKDIDLHVSRGSIFGLLGPNGAGKTSLIRIINMITAPDEGNITFNGESLSHHHIAHIGYLPEERGLYPKMKVGEQLLYLARLKGLDSNLAKQRIALWLERFEIEDWRHRTLEELSKGMAQKVQFISTVIHQPSLLIFDEPFTGFDPVNTELIKDEIRRLRNEGATVLFSTHRMESVEEMCDEIALINNGKKILEGRINNIKNEYKSSKYQITLENAKIPEKLVNGEIINQSGNNEYLLIEVAMNEDNPNMLVEELIKYGRVTSFKERIPSLSEIFIQKVKS